MGLCLLAKLLNGALSATHTRSNITSEKKRIITQLWFFNGTLMGLCLLAMLCLMASTAVFNGALSASPSFVLMGLCLLAM